MDKPTSPPRSASRKKTGVAPARPASSVADTGPHLTPESIARSEFGRWYWGGRANAALVHQQLAANERMADQRRAWKAALRKQLAARSEEWARRRAKARRAHEEAD